MRLSKDIIAKGVLNTRPITRAVINRLFQDLRIAGVVGRINEVNGCDLIGRIRLLISRIEIILRNNEVIL